jgi:hypothetical protein
MRPAQCSDRWLFGSLPKIMCKTGVTNTMFGSGCWYTGSHGRRGLAICKVECLFVVRLHVYMSPTCRLASAHQSCLFPFYASAAWCKYTLVRCPAHCIVCCTWECHTKMYEKYYIRDMSYAGNPPLEHKLRLKEAPTGELKGLQGNSITIRVAEVSHASILRCDCFRPTAAGQQAS